MKKIYYLILTTAIVSACSTPKYTASFNSYESHAAKSAVKPIESPLPTVNNDEVVLASISSAPVEISTKAPVESKTYVQMNKSERKALRNHLRAEVRSYMKEKSKPLSVESTQATKAMDNDLKLAAIFGAIGVVASIIGGNVFWIIGGIAFIIGVVFFVKWLVRQ